MSEGAFTLELPKGEQKVTLEANRSVIIVGANGAGKTRLGNWIEFESSHREIAYRVAAQRALMMPTSVSPKDPEEAKAELLYGSANAIDNPNSWSMKRGHKYRNKPAVGLLNDFQKLLVALASEQYKKLTARHAREKKTGDVIPRPDTTLDQLKSIWEEVLPHRELVIEGTSINAIPSGGGKPYSGAKMSDGERAAFYLIGQCLLAPQDGYIIVDEPEIHIHRAIQNKLWQRIEAERPDCLFIYLTHDLDFAAYKPTSKKIWLQSYDGDKEWFWESLPEQEEIPEELLMEILGSRKPILFVEGKKEKSLDYLFFSSVYPDCTVIPRGGSSQVIESTRSFAALKRLHELECFGIIDRDHRDEKEVEYLRNQSIYVIDVREIENLLVTEEVMRVYAQEQHMVDTDERIDFAKQAVFQYMTDHVEEIVASVVDAEVSRKLSTYRLGQKSVEAIRREVERLYSQIEIDTLYEGARERIQRILAERDYTAALREIENKGIISIAAKGLGVKGKSYLEFMERLIASKDNSALVKALKTYTPSLPISGTGTVAAVPAEAFGGDGRQTQEAN